MCGSNANADEAKKGRLWCDSCNIRALKLLVSVSGCDCSKWTDTYAGTYVSDVKTKMMKAKEPDLKKKPSAGESNAKAIGIDGKPPHECFLCVLGYEGDKVGKKAGKEPAEDEAG